MENFIFCAVVFVLRLRILADTKSFKSTTTKNKELIPAIQDVSSLFRYSKTFEVYLKRQAINFFQRRMSGFGNLVTVKKR